MKWIHKQRASFGAPFLFLVTSIYWTQGFRSLPWMAISYQLKDGLNLSPSAAQFATTIAFMPWSIKPIYGILSDCIPIKGSRRVSYLIISSVLSFVPWLLLGLSESMRSSSVFMVGLLTLQNVGTAMADVVIDAMIAEAARRERAECAGDLQSISWFAMALGGMFGSIFSGFALSAVDVKDIFLAFTIFPVLQLASCGLIDEKALTREAMEADHVQGDLCFGGRKDGAQDKEDHRTCGQAIVRGQSDGCGEVSIGGIGQSNGHEEAYAEEDDDWVQVEGSHSEEAPSAVIGSTTGFVRERVSAPQGHTHHTELDPSLQFHLRQRHMVLGDDAPKNHDIVDPLSSLSFITRLTGTFQILLKTIKQPAIRRPMVWFLLAQVCVPSLSTMMFYYQTNHLHLDASFLGTSRLIGWGALMLGTFVYNQYLKNVQLRRIFWWTQSALALITLSDVLLVSGISTVLGIPNKLFILGASALGDAVNQFKFMPFLVLSGRLCEPGIEGTLFALFMSLNNLGATLSSFFGAGLASVLHISSDHFEKLGLGIFIQSLCTLFPIFFLRLIPEGTGSAEKKLN